MRSGAQGAGGAQAPRLAVPRARLLSARGDLIAWDSRGASGAAGRGGDTRAGPLCAGQAAAELERELGISGVAKLASNENPYGPSPRALAAMHAALGQIWLYPDGASHELKQALAGHLGVGAGHLTIGNGSNDLLVLLAEAFLTPAHSAVYSQYGFAIYRS
jgi:histidinol-phosphate aminotransferase